MTVALPTSSDYPLILHGDCVDELRRLPDSCIDAVITDPPYGISFMGKGWDAPGRMLGYMATGDEKRYALAYGGTHSRGYADNDNQAFQAWCGTWLVECLRVLKPGGHLLAFGGTRTWHRLTCAVEDAGFEIRDSIAWLYGSGFPKSLNVGKAIDAALGVDREVIGTAAGAGSSNTDSLGVFAPTYSDTAAASAEARQWDGWGTALKPGHEPIVVARAPLAGTVAANVLAHGTGALNIDASRLEFTSEADRRETTDKNAHADFGSEPPSKRDTYGDYSMVARRNYTAPGRWPANVALDEATAEALDRQSGVTVSNRIETQPTTTAAQGWGNIGSNRGPRGHADSGGASRFFYTAKASAAERPKLDGEGHPTVKPLALMQWLVALVCPPNAVVLDPFAGSGTTVEACIRLGARCVAMEQDAAYVALIEERVSRNNLSLFATHTDPTEHPTEGEN